MIEVEPVKNMGQGDEREKKDGVGGQDPVRGQ